MSEPFPAPGADGPAVPAAPGLHDRPVLVIDPGLHTGAIRSAAADVEGRWAVTGASDKTVRVWSLADGALLRTIRLPAGPGNVGSVDTVAMSPDGALIAVGGWTRWTYDDPQEQIYLFDRDTGALVRRIDGVSNNVRALAFSSKGHQLAAVLGGGHGLRVYARERDWAEAARDEDYGADSYGLTFASDSRLATTELEGKVRLYAGDLEGDLRPTAAIAAPSGREPFRIAFSPDGTRLAVGYDDSAAVTLLDGRTLAPLPDPDLGGVDTGRLSVIAWSRDGNTLFAAGTQSTPGELVFAWGDAGAGARRALPAGQNTVLSLVPLPGSDLLVADGDSWLARLQADGGTRWAHEPSQVDFRGQYDTLAVSGDGACVAFSFQWPGQEPARFDLAARALMLDPPADARTAGPRRDGPPVLDWLNNLHPTLGGRPLPLDSYEQCRSFAVHPAGDRFVLGAEWSLRAFDSEGEPLWRRPVLHPIWAVNVSGDGRLVVAAYADGTIRWHRMADGAELLAFIPLPNRADWVAWTPEGFYNATPGAHGVLRWHVNRGWDAPADSVPVTDIASSFRPAVLPLVLQELETPRALGLAALAEHRREVAIQTRSGVPPGARLHLLAVGISAYNEEHARHLRLRYADRDAHDLASTLVSTQGSLYAEVVPQVLPNQDANKDGILAALETMRAGMRKCSGDDLAVVHFSGHGAMVDGKLYLLPHEVDARGTAGIKSKGLSADQLRDELVELAKHGRVLVLLDACHSGATTMNGAQLAMDATALRTGLAAANVTVLTSSSGREPSREDPAWGHGAFTKVVLDALRDPAADIERKGLINTAGLAYYVATRVAALTGGMQNPGLEVRFHSTLFATGR